MTQFRIGTAGFHRPRARYARSLGLVEVDLRAPSPAPRTLARWREETGANVAYALVVPPTLYGDADFPLRQPERTRAEIAQLASFVKSVKPAALLFRTPSVIRPGTASLTRLLEVFERVRPMVPVLAWEPYGMWQLDQARAVAAPLAVTVVCDPLRDEVGDERVVYARLRGLGSDSRYHAGRMEQLVDACADAEEAFVVFDSPDPWGDALRCARVAAGAASLEEDAEEPEGECAAADDEDDEDGYGLDSAGKDDEEDGEEGDDDDDDDDEDDEDAT